MKSQGTRETHQQQRIHPLLRPFFVLLRLRRVHQRRIPVYRSYWRSWNNIGYIFYVVTFQMGVWLLLPDVYNSCISCLCLINIHGMDFVLSTFTVRGQINKSHAVGFDKWTDTSDTVLDRFWTYVPVGGGGNHIFLAHAHTRGLWVSFHPCLFLWAACCIAGCGETERLRYSPVEFGEVKVIWQEQGIWLWISATSQHCFHESSCSLVWFETFKSRCLIRDLWFAIFGWFSRSRQWLDHELKQWREAGHMYKPRTGEQ